MHKSRNQELQSQKKSWQQKRNAWHFFFFHWHTCERTPSIGSLSRNHAYGPVHPKHLKHLEHLKEWASAVKRCWYFICFSPRRSPSFLSFLQLPFFHTVQIIEVIGAKCKLLKFERVMMHILISSHLDVSALPQLPSFASFISNHLPRLSRLFHFTYYNVLKSFP